LVLFASLSAACGSLRSDGGPNEAREERRIIATILDDWHSAASRADGEAYLGRLAEDAVYLGTDATERWTRQEFSDFCGPHFARGTGWTYECRERHVVLDGRIAWFDERLWNDKYGECRGTGVLRKEAGEWKIAHYSLTFPVPNELAGQVVDLIRGR
jgi:ketosteroid isomerase-like protein